MAKNLEISQADYTYNNLIAGDPVLKSRIVTLAASQGAMSRGQILMCDPANSGATANQFSGFTHGVTLTTHVCVILAEDVVDSGSTQKVLVYVWGEFNEDTVFDVVDTYTGGAGTAAQKEYLRLSLPKFGIFLKDFK